jgi:hypothetical protein
MYVNMVKISIPLTKDMNRPGQNDPANPETASSVADINNHVIGIPPRINNHFHDLPQDHNIGALT